MKRQSSTKKQPKHSHEGPALEQEKPSLKPKKMGSEIDEIFAGKKRKRPENDKKANTGKPVRVSASNGKSHDGLRIEKSGKSKSLKENGLAGPTSRPRKKTSDGLTIYSEEELGIGKAEAGDLLMGSKFKHTYTIKIPEIRSYNE
ncbi:hypothetical protein DH2020_012613 [Rehmannia glutinosa]|uniref:Uncharacterized protein n=1 Tax=Rehmannia glutinosa TaxID=99300 RepID=A0ABR0X399_REHGL